MASGTSQLDEILVEARTMAGHLKAAMGRKKKKKRRTSRPNPFRWRQRNDDGNIVPQTIKSTPSNSHVKQTRSVMPSAPEEPSADMPDEQEARLDSVLKELESLFSETSVPDPIPDCNSQTVASDWNMRKSASSERWKEARPQLLDSMLRENCLKPRRCQRCQKTEATIRCAECMPTQYLCSDCDVIYHKSNALHNRTSRINGFHMPLPPTVAVMSDAKGHYSHQTCVRILPMELPQEICDCPAERVTVISGRPVVFVNMKGRYDLSLPELHCGGCGASWTPGLHDVQMSGYWPASVNFCTLFDVAVFRAFKEMKLAAPGSSRLAFIRMLEAQTRECGRTGKVCSDTFHKSFMEWVIVSNMVDKLCLEEPFSCPACTPHMLAVSVDGNRKLYRFKKDAHSEERGYFEGVLLCRDDEVTAFVEDIQMRTKHVPGKGVCGRSQLKAAKETSNKRNSSSLDEQGLEVAVCRHGIILRALNMYRGEIFAYPMFLQKEVAAMNSPVFFCMDVVCKYWPYITRISETCPEYNQLTTMKPLLSVLHAKAHGIKCEIKWGGGSQVGAGSTLGEEVEMVNSFLSRTAINTKFMSKGARTDMLTVQIMSWNKRKVENMCDTLCTRLRKTQQNLLKEKQSLEILKSEMSANEGTIQQWVRDVQEWAKHELPADSDDSLIVVRRKIEETSLGLRQRKARLYSQTDSNTGRSVIRSRMWREKQQLENYIAQHDDMVQPKDQIGPVDNALQAGYIFPWQLPPSDGVDFLSKKKVFDKVMHKCRLEEEVMILATEVRQHWEFIKKREKTLGGSSISARDSHCSLSEESLQGLQGELKRRRFQQQSLLVTVQRKYLKMIQAGLVGSVQGVDEGDDLFDEEGRESDFGSSSDEDDDMYMKAIK